MSHAVMYVIQWFWKCNSDICTNLCIYICSLEVLSLIPADFKNIYRLLCGFICVTQYQSIKIKPTYMYIARTGEQFKTNTHGVWNWHLCIPDGLSVVQCSIGHVMGNVCLKKYRWHETNMLDKWHLVVNDNLSAPLLVNMHFTVPEHQI